MIPADAERGRWQQKIGVGQKQIKRGHADAAVEIVEVPDHPWFIGCQFHPEFKSKPLAPHPLFAAFIHASVENRRQRLGLSADPHPAEARVRAADSAATD